MLRFAQHDSTLVGSQPAPHQQKKEKTDPSLAMLAPDGLC
jgi:hypothetical protein